MPQDLSSHTINEFPRFISEKDKHKQCSSNISTNIVKNYELHLFCGLFLSYCHCKDIKIGVTVYGICVVFYCLLLLGRVLSKRQILLK